VSLEFLIEVAAAIGVREIRIAVRPPDYDELTQGRPAARSIAQSGSTRRVDEHRQLRLFEDAISRLGE
jgi:hypothetical protein